MPVAGHDHSRHALLEPLLDPVHQGRGILGIVDNHQLQAPRRLSVGKGIPPGPIAIPPHASEAAEDVRVVEEPRTLLG